MQESLEFHGSHYCCYIGQRSAPIPSWHPTSFPDSIPALDDFPGVSA